jgi:hypothetical protein
MRPLTNEEKTRAKKTGLGQWRKVWILTALRTGLTILFVILGTLTFLSFWVFLLAAYLVMSLVWRWMMLQREYAKWKRQLDADLEGGLVEQKPGKLLDRFWYPDIFTRRRYLVWVDGFEFKVDKALGKNLEAGDAVSVDYLPMTRIVLATEKISQMDN